MRDRSVRQPTRGRRARGRAGRALHGIRPICQCAPAAIASVSDSSPAALASSTRPRSVSNEAAGRQHPAPESLLLRAFQQARGLLQVSIGEIPVSGTELDDCEPDHGPTELHLVAVLQSDLTLDLELRTRPVQLVGVDTEDAEQARGGPDIRVVMDPDATTASQARDRCPEQTPTRAPRRGERPRSRCPGPRRTRLRRTREGRRPRAAGSPALVPQAPSPRGRRTPCGRRRSRTCVRPRRGSPCAGRRRLPHRAAPARRGGSQPHRLQRSRFGMQGEAAPERASGRTVHVPRPRAERSPRVLGSPASERYRPSWSMCE